MPKLKVDETFEMDGDTFEKGKTYTVPERIAERAESEGYGSRPDQNLRGQVPKLETPDEDIWEKLKRKAKSREERPPDWYPQVDDWLFGTVVETGEGKNGRFAVVEVAEEPVRAKSGPSEANHKVKDIQPKGKVVVWEVKDLTDFFDRIQAGLRVALQYKGTIKTSSGHEAKIYNSAVEG